MQNYERHQLLTQLENSLDPEDHKQASRIRSSSGPGAGAHLLQPTHKAHKIPDADFATSMRRRIGSPWASSPFSQPTHRTCQHTSQRGGRLCNHPLDPAGTHAHTCNLGGHPTTRHDALVAFLHNEVTNTLHLPCTHEQHQQPSPGHTDDRIDLILALEGDTLNIDVAIVSPLTTQPDLQRTRAKHDGHPSKAEATRKRTRYPNHNVLPFIIEDHGRPGQDTITLIRTLATKYPDLTTSEAATHQRQCIEAIIHTHTSHKVRTAERTR